MESGQRVSSFLRECEDVEGRRKGASTSARDARRVLFSCYLVESFDCVCGPAVVGFREIVRILGEFMSARLLVIACGRDDGNGFVTLVGMGRSRNKRGKRVAILGDGRSGECLMDRKTGAEGDRYVVRPTKRSCKGPGENAASAACPCVGGGGGVGWRNAGEGPELGSAETAVWHWGMDEERSEARRSALCVVPRAASAADGLA